MKHRLVVSSLFIYLSFGNGIGIGIVSELAWIRFRSFVNVNSKQVYSLNDLEKRGRFLEKLLEIIYQKKVSKIVNLLSRFW